MISGLRAHQMEHESPAGEQRCPADGDFFRSCNAAHSPAAHALACKQHSCSAGKPHDMVHAQINNCMQSQTSSCHSCPMHMHARLLQMMQELAS